MSRKSSRDASEILADIAIKGIQEKKGKDIVVLNLKKTGSSVADFFVICTGDSTTQVDAIAKSVDIEIKKAIGEDPWHKEGFQNAQWILLDYVNVVVHVFQRETRDFYCLEKLWADAEIKEIV